MSTTVMLKFNAPLKYNKPKNAFISIKSVVLQ